MTVRELVALLQVLPESSYVEFLCEYPEIDEDGNTTLEKTRIRIDEVTYEELSSNVVLS